MVQLSGARQTLNKLMVDQCVIAENQDHLASAVLDLETGKLEADTDASTLYKGKCRIVPGPYRAGSETPGGLEASSRIYVLSIPYTHPKPINVGAEGKLTKCVDKSLVGRQFVVRDILRSTFFVERQLSVEIMETSRDA